MDTQLQVNLHCYKIKKREKLYIATAFFPEIRFFKDNPKPLIRKEIVPEFNLDLFSRYIIDLF